MKTRLAYGFLAMVLWTSAGYAFELDGKKSIGFARSIGGPAGLALGLGVGDSQFEFIFGGHYLAPETDDVAVTLAVGTGIHFHLLRAEEATFAVGLRLNTATGSAIRVEQSSTGLRTRARTDNIVQWGLDIPLRVYWFPNKAFSIHTEWGIVFSTAPAEGQLFPSPERNGFVLEPSGVRVGMFESAEGFGEIGMTFWW